MNKRTLLACIYDGWRKGLSTKQIARMIYVEESVVWNNLDEAKRLKHLPKKYRREGVVE